jgi:hypothetical protein
MRATQNSFRLVVQGITGVLASLALCRGQTVSHETVQITTFSPPQVSFMQSNIGALMADPRWAQSPSVAKAVGEEVLVQQRHLRVNAHRTITYVQDFKFVYPTNIDYWVYSTGNPTQRLWVIQSGLYGRCLLQMRIPFEIDSTQTTLSVMTHPPYNWSATQTRVQGRSISIFIGVTT